MKEELKELIKAHKWKCAGIERHTKNGEFTHYHMDYTQMQDW